MREDYLKIEYLDEISIDVVRMFIPVDLLQLDSTFVKRFNVIIAVLIRIFPPFTGCRWQRIVRNCLK